MMPAAATSESVRVDFPVGEFLVLFFFGGGRGQRERGGREREGSGLRGGEEREGEASGREQKGARAFQLAAFPLSLGTHLPFSLLWIRQRGLASKNKKGRRSGTKGEKHRGARALTRPAAIVRRAID
jgi:hypothetical protein